MRDTPTLLSWSLLGRPLPPPHQYKEMTVLTYAAEFGTRVFFETGTYEGAMILPVIHAFKRYVSVEVDHRWYDEALRYFGGLGRLELHHGDSADYLFKLLGSIKEPCLFWLDAHGPGQSPVLCELEMIARHHTQDVLLLDDNRLFGVEPGWPSKEQVLSKLAELFPEHEVETRLDIIRATPKGV